MESLGHPPFRHDLFRTQDFWEAVVWATSDKWAPPTHVPILTTVTDRLRSIAPSITAVGDNDKVGRASCDPDFSSVRISLLLSHVGPGL